MFSEINQYGRVSSAWLKLGRKEKKVRVSQDADNYVQVKVISAKYDTKTEKTVYKTEDTTKVFDATPEEVAKIVTKALQVASGQK